MSTPANIPIRNAPHGDTEGARPTHVRVTARKLSITRAVVGDVYPVVKWIGTCPVIKDLLDRHDPLVAGEWEPANPPAPVAADTARPHNPHGSLDFDVVPQPSISQSEFRNLLCVLHGLDGFDLLKLPDDTARAFIANPLRQFLRADDATASVIWNAMMLRVSHGTPLPTPLPTAFDACLAVVKTFDDVSDETLALVIAAPRSDRPEMWTALQAARSALVAEGFRS